MNRDDLLLLFVLFFIYSLMGWIWECIFESVINHKILNRGFLTGPYIPIYGFAGLIYYNFFQRFKSEVFISYNTLYIFIGGIFIATIAEYVTSYVLEKFLHARWWDYSDYPLNLNGRICVIASIFWGIVTVLIINLVNPKLIVLLNTIDHDIKLIYVSSMTTMFIIDLVLTINSILDLHNKLRLIISLESLRNVDIKSFLGTYKDRIYKLANPFTRRIVNSFPEMKFNSKKMQSALSKLKGIKQDKHK